MNANEQDFLIPFKDVSVKCCKCYADYWRSLRKDQDKKDCFHFDYSIKKVKSFRKYFSEERTLFHFCINCFNVIMCSIPISIVEFEVNQRKRGGCVANILLGNEIGRNGLSEKICNGCINFVIERFSKDDFIIV